MIALLSKRISLFLCEKHIIKSDTLEIYQYGFEIIISTIIDFMITLCIGLIFNMKLLSLIYYFIFVSIRQVTGGYHASSHFKCNLIFAISTFVIFGMSKLSAIVQLYSFGFHILLLFFTIIIIANESPIENPNKPLTEKQKKNNKYIGTIITILISIVSCLFFKAKIILSALLAFTMFTIALMIAIEMPTGKEE